MVNVLVTHMVDILLALKYSQTGSGKRPWGFLAQRRLSYALKRFCFYACNTVWAKLNSNINHKIITCVKHMLLYSNVTIA